MGYRLSLRNRIPIDPREQVGSSYRPDVAGRCRSYTIEAAPTARIRSTDATPGCSIPVLQLPVISNRPDIVRGNGGYRGQNFVGRSHIVNETPADPIPVIAHWCREVALVIRPLAVAHCPDIIGGGG